jgi:hypothetical protein
LWQNFPIWQKEKKKRKEKGTTKALNDFFEKKIRQIHQVSENFVS